MIVRGETEHMEVALDTDKKEIYVTQRWKLNFIDQIDIPWKNEEKYIFRQEMKKSIYSCWDDKAYAIVNTKRGPVFNQNYGKIPFPIRIKLDIVEYHQHWNVNIYKPITSHVIWPHKTVNLTNACIYPGDKIVLARTMAHEFGHTFGNTRYLDINGADEYHKWHPLYLDKKSIMNHGDELRHRHFAHLRNILHEMLPGSYFCIRLS